MKYRCYAALALAMLLPGCAAAPDLTPVWQRDLPASGVHIELANAVLLSDADAYYAATREELYVHNVSVLPAVKADGQPVVTFYGAAAQDIDLVYLEDIGDVYVDYDRIQAADQAGLHLDRRGRVRLLRVGHRVQFCVHGDDADRRG